MEQEKLRIANPKKLLIELSIPAICAQIVTLLYNTVDRMYIGRMADGTMAMAGVGLCMPIVTILVALTGLLCRGGAPLAGIAMGRQDQAQAERYLGNSFLTLTASSIVLMIAGLLFRDPLLRSFGASEVTLPYAADYLTIYLFGTIFIQLTLGMNYYITTQGFARMAMITTMVGAALNIALDPLLMFTFRMGVRGAALATVIAQSISFILVFSFLLSKKSKLRLSFGSMKLDGTVMKKLLALGAAPFFMTASEGVLHICFNMQARLHGGDLAVSVMTILFSMFQFVNSPVQGLAAGSQPIISYNFGAKAFDRVHTTLSFAVKIATVYSLITVSLMLIFPRFFLGLFNQDPALLELGAPMFRMYIFGNLIMGANTIYQQTYTSLGEGKVSFFFAFLRKVILLIPLLYILPAVFPWGVLAVTLAESISDIITSGSNTIYFRRFLKTKLQ